MTRLRDREFSAEATEVIKMVGRLRWSRWVSIAAVIGSTAVSACRSPFSSNDDTQIRLRNASAFELTSVTFAPGNAQLKFARIAPGEVTSYARVSSAYSYGYLDALVNGERRTIQPIDFVGENPIGDGKFTYVISIDAVTRNPAVTLVKD